MGGGFRPRLPGTSPRSRGVRPQTPSHRSAHRSISRALQPKTRLPRDLPADTTPDAPMKFVRTALIIPAFCLGLAARAGNAVLDWNQEAIDATRLARNPPPLAA